MPDVPVAWADNTNPRSFASGLRRRRFGLFMRLLADLPRPTTVLDVGGTSAFWTTIGFLPSAEISITLLNTAEPVPSQNAFPNLIGDARNMVLEDRSFDVVFSNSVIEHVGGFDDQRRMAQEVQRVGRRCFIQTPNRYFPLEPHFLFPFYQFLPVRSRVWLLRRFHMGWIPRAPDERLAKNVVESIRLLSRGEMLELFPGAELYEERVLGITKSFVALAGWERGLQPE